MDNLPTILKLADEGVPVLCIARAMKIPSADIYDQLNQAWFQGKLLGIPRADWPSNGSREERTPELRKMAELGEKALLGAIARVFQITITRARIVLALIRFPEVSNEYLHQIYNNRDGRIVENDIKIVDIQLCHIRRKLQPFGLEIETHWGFGKSMPATDRRRALSLILRALEE
jgi:hypothetical protein